MEDGFPDDERGDQGLAGLGSPHCFPHQNGERVERYSRKVFVGGLPPDIDEGAVVTLRSKGLHFWAVSDRAGCIFSSDLYLDTFQWNLRRSISCKSFLVFPAPLPISLHFVCLISDEITASFRRFGHLFVDWPHKAESKSYFPPKGMLNPICSIFPLCFGVSVTGERNTQMCFIVFFGTALSTCQFINMCASV